MLKSPCYGKQLHANSAWRVRPCWGAPLVAPHTRRCVAEGMRREERESCSALRGGSSLSRASFSFRRFTVSHLHPSLCVTRKCRGTPRKTVKRRKTRLRRKSASAESKMAKEPGKDCRASRKGAPFSRKGQTLNSEFGALEAEPLTRTPRGPTVTLHERRSLRRAFSTH